MRILFVACAASSHTARWIGQIVDQGWDLHMFDPAGSQPHDALNYVTLHTFFYPIRHNRTLKIHARWPARRGNNFLTNRLPEIGIHVVPESSIRLARLIKRLQPDIIHSLRTQDEGYTLVNAKRILGEILPAPWIHSTWGSDFFYFRHLTEHQERLQAVAAESDYIITDCKRDVKLVQQFGFLGRVMGVFPTVGAFDIASMRSLSPFVPPSRRGKILLKGYDAGWGRACTALNAIEQCADLTRNYELVIYLAGDTVKEAAFQLERKYGLKVRILPYSSLETLLQLKAQARVEIALSTSDGTPNSMLEAMVMGAFPIQSNTAATSEWIEENVNGISVPYDDVEIISSTLRHVLTDDKMVDQAAEYNYRLMMKRIDVSVIKPAVIDMYKAVSAMKSGL